MRFCVVLLCIAGLGVMAAAQPAAMKRDSDRAKQLLAEKRYAEAIPLLEKLVEAMPTNAPLRFNLGLTLQLAGQEARAIPQLESVVKQDPAHGPALMALSGSYLRTGQPQRATPLLERVVRAAPNSLDARAMLNDALLMQGRYAAAIPHLKKLAQADSRNPRTWYSLGRCYEEVARSAFEELGKMGPDSAYWLMLMGDARLSAGRNTAAFGLYRAVVEKQPQFRGAHAGLAEVYRRTDHADWARIEEDLEAKIPKPQCATPSSECQFRQRRFDDALQTSMRTKTPAALYWRAKAANELARMTFAELGKLPPSLEGHKVLGEYLRNQGRHEESIGEWRAALSMAPNDQGLELELATSVYLSRDFAVAEKNLRPIAARNPDAADVQFMLGNTLLLLQRAEESLGPLQAAVRLDNGYLPARAALGRALMQAGEAKEAIPHLEAALQTDHDGSLHFQLSRAYQDMGQAEKASEMLKKYQDLSQAAAPQETSITGPEP